MISAECNDARQVLKCDQVCHAQCCAQESRHTATHCNTLQHTAVHCNTLQRTATSASHVTTCATHNVVPKKVGTLQHTAAHHNMHTCKVLFHIEHRNPPFVCVCVCVCVHASIIDFESTASAHRLARTVTHYNTL